VLRGDPAQRSLWVLYIKQGKLIEEDAAIAPEDLANASRPLKELPRV